MKDNIEVDGIDLDELFIALVNEEEYELADMLIKDIQRRDKKQKRDAKIAAFMNSCNNQEQIDARRDEANMNLNRRMHNFPQEELIREHPAPNVLSMPQYLAKKALKELRELSDEELEDMRDYLNGGDPEEFVCKRFGVEIDDIKDFQ